MNKKTILLLAFLMALAFVFSACGQIEQRAQRERLVEDSYEIYIYDLTEYKVAGVSVPRPNVRGMKDLENQANINGRLGAMINRTARLPEDDKLVPRYVDHEVMMLNEHLLVVKFIADERAPFADEVMVFVHEESALIFSLARIAGNAANNDQFENIYNIFETYRAQQNQAELSIDELPDVFLGFLGDDVSDMTVEFNYYKDGKQSVELPFNDIYDDLNERGQEFFNFILD